MAQNPASTAEDKKKRPFNDLLIWLALIPLILLTLLFCGQLALFLIPSTQGDNTASLLKADYQPWPYDRIPPVNVAAFMTDVVKEQALLGTPEATIVVGDYWEIATSTGIPVAMSTGTPRSPTATERRQNTSTPKATTPAPITNTPIPTSTHRPTSTPLPTITRTRIPPTYTSTSEPTDTPRPRPTRTRTPTRTPTRPVNYTPTNTQGPPPPPPATLTPTPTRTSPPGPTGTFTPTFTQTLTPTFTNTPVFITPTYAPLRPIAENDGIANQDNGGCRIYFGYWNDNPNEVDIPVGPLNNLDDPAAQANPPQPTHFLVGRVFGAFEFTWYSGLPLTWTLDNRTATVNWCY